jgi:hypothetical protein
MMSDDLVRWISRLVVVVAIVGAIGALLLSILDASRHARRECDKRGGVLVLDENRQPICLTQTSPPKKD